MKVAFELTPLGSGRYYPRNRTGIFRVCSELLATLASRPDVELLLTSASCRGEAEDEVRELGVSARFHRSAIDRLVYPFVKRVCIPSHVKPGTALSSSRRKLFRTLVQSIEALGGHPRSLAHEIEVCHSPYYPPSQVGWGATFPATRIVTVHDVLPLTHPQFFPPGDDRLLSQVMLDIQAGAVAHCVSEFTRGELLTQVPEAEARTFVAPLAANREHFFPRDAHNVATVLAKLGIRGPYILCLGTLDPRKNLRLAIEAFDEVRREGNNIQLVITGAAARNSSPFEAIIAPFTHAKSGCVITGFVPEHDLPALYSGATLVLFPSLAEGFGLPALEAMACGAPVITSNATSLPEVVGSGGLVLDPTDGAAWSQAIMRLLDSPTERVGLSRAGMHRATQFTWERTAERLVAAYQSYRPS